MQSSPAPTNRFVLQAFDMTLWCPIAEAVFAVPDIDALRAILGEPAADDLELRDTYSIEESSEREMIEARFGVGFPSEIFGRSDVEITVFRKDGASFEMPYLSHTGYELPLLLDGRKKLATMYHEYPPAAFAGETSFDLWVDKGLLHKEVTVQPFEQPIRGFDGLRTAYYTLKGEEWRIPATKLIWEAAKKSGGWTEHFERLEGMLFGYEDWQNDWWILNRRKLGRPQVMCRRSSEP